MKDVETSGAPMTMEEKFDAEIAQHAETERLLNLEIDADILKYIDHPILGISFDGGLKVTRPSNPSLYYIVPNEFAERFCYYGISPLIKNLIGLGLGVNTLIDPVDATFDKSTTNKYKQYWDFLTYTTPLLGAVLSDSYMDKYKTIMILSFFYLCGVFLLSVSANPSIMGFEVIYKVTQVLDDGSVFTPTGTGMSPTLVYSALGLMAFGAGGIKPCVSAHGGDQFIPEQSRTSALNQFYTFFYMAINVGSLLAGLSIPKVKDLSCFGEEKDCFTYAFFICSAVFLAAYVAFGIGKKYYRVVPPIGRFILFDYFAVGFVSLFKGSSQAVKQYGRGLVTEAGDLAKVIVLLIPVPFFWMGYNQSGNLWQDTTDRMGDSILTSEQVQNIPNPLIIVIFAPIFNAYIYPMFGPKFTLPRRICVGYFFAALAMCVAAVIDNYTMANCIPNTSTGVCEFKDLDNTIWIIPIFIITCAEILISISGLNLVYEEVGKRSKSMCTALWLFGSALGSILNPFMAAWFPYADRVNVEKGKYYTYGEFYFICAGVILAAGAVQGLLVYFYVPKAQRAPAVDVVVTKEIKEVA